MFKNYLKTALRNFLRQKGFSLINVAGLAIGMVCCMLILLYVRDELNFDAFHKQADRIFRVVDVRKSADKGDRHIPQVMGPVGPALKKDFPEVKNTVRLISSFVTGRFVVEHGAARFYEGEHLFVETNFLDVFDFELLHGDRAAVLKEPNSVALTESSAKKYFGDEKAFGQTIKVERFGDFKVTGVLKDPPPNSHLNFSMLFSFATLQARDGWRRFSERWDSDGFVTYLVLNDAASARSLETKLADFNHQYRGEAAKDSRFYLQPLRDIHFRSNHIEFDRNENKGDIAYVYIFSAIALFIVLIACINYMNLATARSMNRAREVGMRKVVGAYRLQLVGQFLSEALLFAVISFVVACGIVELLLPAFSQFTGKQLVLDLVKLDWLPMALLAMALLVGLISGSYPAFFLSRLRPAFILKGSATSSSSWFRQGLVVTQFALSIVMIVATVVVYNQMNYIRTKRLGFNQEQLLVVDINSGAARSNFQAIKTEMGRSPAVRGVSVSSRVPGDWKNIVEVGVVPEDAPETDIHTLNFIGIDEDFMKVFEVELADGRNFSPEFPTDTSAILLNETAAREFGWDSPIGKSIRVPEENFQARVIGVVKDFHFRSLHEKIGPLVLANWNNRIDRIDYFTARISAQEIPATLKYLRGVHEKFDQVTPFEFNFLDERLNDFYRNDQRVGRLFGIAAGLAIFVACLGLFGMAAYSTEQRRKEIGVRKVLGASAPNVILLLSKDFTRLVVLALVVASPAAYFFMNRWLQDFAYRVPINPGMFLLAGFVALAIAWLTVSYQAVKAALANPVESLRYE